MSGLMAPTERAPPGSPPLQHSHEHRHLQQQQQEPPQSPQYPPSFDPSSRRNSQNSISASSLRWKMAFVLPSSWSRRGSRSNASGGLGATEEEILNAMKEANRSRTGTVPEEPDEGEGEGEGGRNGNEGQTGEKAEYESVDLGQSHRISTFRFGGSSSTSAFHQGGVGMWGSNRNSRTRFSGTNHHHQQQDSVNSMQQFYHPYSREGGMGGLRGGMNGDSYDDGPPRYQTLECSSQQHRQEERDQDEHRRYRRTYEQSAVASAMAIAGQGFEISSSSGSNNSTAFSKMHQQQEQEQGAVIELYCRNPSQPTEESVSHSQSPRTSMAKAVKAKAIKAKAVKATATTTTTMAGTTTTPIIHKTIAKLTGQSQHHNPTPNSSSPNPTAMSNFNFNHNHYHSPSCVSNSSLASTASSSSTTVISHSRSATGVFSHPQPSSSPLSSSSSYPFASPHSTSMHYQNSSSGASNTTEIAVTPSPSSPANTLNCTQQNSPTGFMAFKLKNQELSNGMMKLANLTTTSEQDGTTKNVPFTTTLTTTMDTDRDTSASAPVFVTNLPPMVNTTQLGMVCSTETTSPVAYSPSAESCLSQSTTGMTLATTMNMAQEEGGEGGEECARQFEAQDMSGFEHGFGAGFEGYAGQHQEPCYSCSVPNWATIKAGLLPTSKHAREALLATIILALVTIALEAILLQRHRSLTTNLMESAGSYEISFFRPLTVYYLIFILAEIFAVGLLWDAAIHKNSLQLVAFTMFEWCMVSYSGLQIWQHDQLVKDIGVPIETLADLGDSNTRMILFSQLGVQVTACLGITLLTWRLYSEFGWLVFQKLGADVTLRKMMKEYRLLFTLLKLDAFFFLGYAIQIAALTDMHWQKGLIEVAFAIPLSAIIILLGFCALRNENKVTMGGFITCLALLIGYMTYRLVALYQTLTGDPTTDPYFFSRKTMTVFAALTLFMTILALINAIVMLYNFNKGLKEAMRQYRIRRSGTVRSVAPSLHRMSLNGNASFMIAGHGCFAAETTVAASGGGGPGSARNSKRTSKRSLLHCDMSSPMPIMVERWQIE